MEQLAYALVIAMEYLNQRNDEDYDEDSDASVLGELAHVLQNSPKDVQDLIGKAAERLLNEEKSRDNPDEKRIEDYENFMDEYFLSDDDD